MIAHRKSRGCRGDWVEGVFRLCYFKREIANKTCLSLVSEVPIYSM